MANPEKIPFPSPPGSTGNGHFFYKMKPSPRIKDFYHMNFMYCRSGP
jgi:hypothetical protein